MDFELEVGERLLNSIHLLALFHPKSCVLFPGQSEMLWNQEQGICS